MSDALTDSVVLCVESNAVIVNPISRVYKTLLLINLLFVIVLCNLRLFLFGFAVHTFVLCLLRHLVVQFKELTLLL